MHFAKKGGAVLATAAVITTGVGLVAPAAQAATTTVREGDFIAALSDTRSAGHVDFLADGLHVYTDDSTSNAKAAEYWAPETSAFPAAVSLSWFGTSPQPGSQIVFDYDGIDGNGNDYNILVGEPVYGDNFWLTNGSSTDAKNADPSGAENGGNGSEWFGTLAEWKAVLPADARVYAYGFSLGSGVKGDGVIDNLTVDDTEYRFTNQPDTPPSTPADVTGSFSTNLERKPFGSQRTVSAVFRSDDQPDNTTVGNKLRWRVTVDGRTAANITQGFDEVDSWSRSFNKRSGTHTVRIYKNNQQVRVISVDTRP